MKTLAIIPARGGSKGIPRKNIKTLAGNVLAPVAPEWPEISPAQRLEITSLMQAAMDADVAYAQARSQAVQTRYALQVKPPLVFRTAFLPEAPIKPRKTLNTALGTASGLMLGVFWVFAAAWWREEGGQDAK